MKHTVKGVRSITVGLAALILCSAGIASAATTLKLNHSVLPTHGYHLGAVRFAELVKERTKGEVIIDVLHSAQLGAERESVEALQLGTLDLTICSTAPVVGFTKSFMVFDLPFIFSNRDEAYKVLDGPIGQKSLAEIEKNSIIGLAFFENGFRHVTNSKQPIIKPEDLKGMKIRTMENKIHMASFRTLGANPTPMAFGEVFTALQQKTVDGQENPMPLIFDMKYYEAQKYLSMTGHFYAAAPLLMSKASFSKLTKEQQQIVRDAAKEATGYQRSLMKEQEDKAREGLIANGMEFTEVDKKIWRDAMEPVYKQFEKEIGPDLIKAVRAQ
jgi:tripartite ATP-independent transporter DctP family solute receptor